MTFKIPKSSLEKINERIKIINYVSNSMTNTILKLSKDEITINFTGNASALRYTFPIEDFSGDESFKFFGINAEKFFQAILSSIPYENFIKCVLTDKQLTFHSDSTSDKIGIVVNHYGESDSEVELINDVFSNTNFKHIFKSTSEIRDFTSLCTSVMSSTDMNNNNCIAVFKDKILYCDRMIVLMCENSENKNMVSDEYFTIHRQVLGLMSLAFPYSCLFEFSEDYKMLSWFEDDNFEIIISSEPCSIAIPDDEQISEIAPKEDSNYITCDVDKLKNCIDFFNGYYATAVWKPLTFSFNKGENKLLYKSPVVDVEKDLSCINEIGNENDCITFNVERNYLYKVLSSAEKTATISFDSESPGLKVVTDDNYTVILAKLSE